MPKLKDFQREDVDFIKAHDLRVLVASAPGTGKTCTTIRAVAESYETSLPAVVVAPASVTRHWGREILRWAPGIHPLIIDDSVTPLPRIRPNTIFVLSWALLDLRWEELCERGVRCVVADEAHYAKNPASLRSMALARLMESAPHRLALTGTPIINQQRELGVLAALLGFPEGNPPMIRRLLEDVAKEIPDKARSYLHVSLPAAFDREYTKAETDFEEWLRREKEKLLGEGMAEYEIERALMAEALAKIGYLRRLVGVAKVEAASLWIARAVRLGEPVVVFLEHQPVLQALRKKLRKQRIRHVVIEGKTPGKKRQEAVDAFQANEYPVLLGTKAAKEGITLTAARHLLFVERFFTSSEEEQAEDRIRRIGQTHPTKIWFLHAGGTVDDRIDAIVRSKRSIVRAAIGSADIAETPTSNVVSLLKQWEDHSEPPAGSHLDQTTLPPLPHAQLVQSISFYGTRWTAKSARVWCRMNGYPAERIERLAEPHRLRAHTTHSHFFKPGSFRVEPIAKDIRLILGTRISKTNERKLLRARARRIAT